MAGGAGITGGLVLIVGGDSLMLVAELTGHRWSRSVSSRMADRPGSWASSTPSSPVAVIAGSRQSTRTRRGWSGCRPTGTPSAWPRRSAPWPTAGPGHGHARGARASRPADVHGERRVYGGARHGAAGGAPVGPAGHRPRRRHDTGHRRRGGARARGRPADRRAGPQDATGLRTFRFVSAPCPRRWRFGPKPL